jgi:5'(3')-deoxyribonucleotidase
MIKHMTKPIIAVDADDTIFDENNAIRMFINETYGFNHTEADYLVDGPFYGYWERIWNVSPEAMNEMYEAFVVSAHKKNLPPIKGALEALRRLKSKYELVVVTARDDRAVEFTHKSRDEHYPEIFKDVHFVPLWGGGEKVTKAKICNEIGASYLIDDSFDHCTLAAEADVQALLFGDYGWNRFQELPAGVTRCKSWDKVLSVVG